MNTKRKKFNILIVDDAPKNIRVVASLLKQEGYQMAFARDGKTALAQTKSMNFDLILLDIMMPEMNGYEVCERLQRDPATKEIPIIFLSAKMESESIVKGFELGAVDYVTKPFRQEELLARVGIHLKLKHLQEKLEEQNLRLQYEIGERMRTEKVLNLLNHLSSLLQACHTEEETYSVVTVVCKQLFPSDSGCLSIIDDSRSMLKEVSFWNSPHLASRLCSVADCQALRGDSMGLGDQISSCPQMECSPDCDTLCAPISTPGGALGILKLYFSQDRPGHVEKKYIHTIETTRIVLTRLVRGYALTLANLRLRETLRRESIHDLLTGLYNRRYMQEALEREAHRAERRKMSVEIIMLDIDHFKNFNDTYGHDAGDLVLRELGQFLYNNTRGEDIACRYGGEEFLLILPGASLEDSTQRAESLRLGAQELQISYQGKSLHITISLGVASLPEHGATANDVVRAADAALYAAKARGRNQVVVALLASDATGSNPEDIQR
ncbi:MAG: diguanylate cyclase [bacterium]|nr:diguanylate cyclase [bacterium]